jgi:hypothetical protein
VDTIHLFAVEPKVVGTACIANLKIAACHIQHPKAHALFSNTTAQLPQAFKAGVGFNNNPNAAAAR